MPHIYLGDKTITEEVDAIRAVFEAKSSIFDVTYDYSTATIFVKLKNTDTGYEINVSWYSTTGGRKLVIYMLDSTGTRINSGQPILSLAYNVDQTWFDYLETKDGILFGGYQYNGAQAHYTYIVPCYAGTECLAAINTNSRGYVCSKTATLMNGQELLTYPTRISQEAIAISNVYAGDDTFFDELSFTTVRPPSASETVYTATIEGDNYYIPSPYAQAMYYLFAVKAPQET